MKRFHTAISVNNIAESVVEYTNKLGQDPDLVIDNEYALWRTDTLNFSIRRDSTAINGSLRHLGWEDSSALEFTEDKDVNGITWECFTAEHQAEEINKLWPKANYEVKVS